MTNLWKNVEKLDGRKLRTLDGHKPFRVVSVTGSKILVLPDAGGKERSISRSTVESAWRHLARRGELTYDDIQGRFSRKDATYLAAILAKLPNVSYRLRPTRLFHRP